jgi:broad specificity phosphatase PhoE
MLMESAQMEILANMGKLVLVRHGHTVLNGPHEEERLRSWLDVPLSDLGLREALDTAEIFSNQSVDIIITSDLYRARQTADAVSAATQAPVISTGALRPWNLGSLGGRRVVDVLPVLEQLRQNPSQPAPGGESLNDFFHRYSAHLWSLLALVDGTGQCVVAVTHVRNFLAAPVVLEGKTASEVAVKGGPETGSIMVVEKHDEKWSIGPLLENLAPSVSVSVEELTGA